MDNDLDFDLDGNIEMDLDTSLMDTEAFADIEEYFHDRNPEEFPDLEGEVAAGGFGVTKIQNLTKVVQNEPRNFQNQPGNPQFSVRLQDDTKLIKNQPKLVQQNFYNPEIANQKFYKPESTQSFKPVKIPVLNQNQEVVREEFACTVCKKTYTAISSLTRHFKDTNTSNRQKISALRQTQALRPDLFIPLINNTNFHNQLSTAYNPCCIHIAQ